MTQSNKISITTAVQPIKRSTRRFYKADEAPSKILCILFGFQVSLNSFFRKTTLTLFRGLFFRRKNNP